MEREKTMTTGIIPLPHFSGTLETASSVSEVLRFKAEAAALREYAKQAKDDSLNAYAMEWERRAERKLGQLMQAQKAAGMMAKGAVEPGTNRGTTRDENGPASITLAEAGIDKHLAQRARDAAAMSQEDFEKSVVEQTSGVLNHRAQGTGQNEWYTPAEYIQAVRDVLGAIDLDPASSEVANKVVGAARFFTAEDDGLTKDWTAKTLWMNPPYAQPLIAQFVEKMVLSFSEGRVLEAIVLTHNYTDTAWFHKAEESCNAICFTRGRVGFLSPDGDKAAPTQGQAFFYFGPSIDRFAVRFQSIGFVVVPYVF
jgi:phage N-6-adenine-methyltransferase